MTPPENSLKRRGARREGTQPRLVAEAMGTAQAILTLGLTSEPAALVTLSSPVVVRAEVPGAPVKCEACDKTFSCRTGLFHHFSTSPDCKKPSRGSEPRRGDKIPSKKRGNACTAAYLATLAGHVSDQVCNPCRQQHKASENEEGSNSKKAPKRRIQLQKDSQEKPTNPKG